MDALEQIKRDWAHAHEIRFNEIAGEVYGWQWGGQSILNQMTRLGAHEHLVSPVLEIGCGGGKWTKWLCDHGFEVTAIDVQDPSIEEAREYEPRARVLKTDGESLPFPRNSFGSVFSFGLFLHLPPELVAQYFWEASKVATQSIVFQLPDMMASWGAAKFTHKIIAKQWNRVYTLGYMNYYVPEMACQMLKLADWPVAEVIGWTGITGPRDMIVVGRKK